MTNYVKEPHTAIFSGPTGCGKTQKILDLIEKEYKHHFDNIVILSGEETLLIIDDMIADEALDKRRQPLLELAISGRHRKHSLWLLTQSYTVLPKNLRRQKKMVFMWYPSEKSDLKMIDEETKLMAVQDEIQGAAQTRKTRVPIRAAGAS